MTQPIPPAPPMGAILDADNYGVIATAVKTGMELDIFDIIAGGHRTLDEIAAAAACSTRGMSVLLDALCTLDLLSKADGCYALTPTAETYLVRGAPGYCVPIYLAWLQAREKFIDFVRTGNATLNLTAPSAEEIWESYVAAEAVRLPELVEQVRQRWSTANITPETYPAPRVLDIGCGCAFKSLTLIQPDPGAHLTGIDSPRVLAIARRVADQMGLSDRATFIEGDANTPVPAGAFDIVIYGNLLHYYPPADSIDLLKRAYEALAPGGVVIIYAKPVDEERRKDPALLSLIDVSNCAPFAQLYTFTEYRGLLEAAGFTDVELAAPVLTLGHKLRK